MARQVTIALFFLVLMALLCLHIQLPATPDYNVFNRTLERAAMLEYNDNKLSAEELKSYAEGRYSESGTVPYYHKAVSLHVRVSETLNYLENYKEKVAAKVSFKNGFLSDGRNRKWLLEIFAGQKGWYRIQTRLDTLASFMLTCVDSSAYTEIKKILPLQHDSVTATRLFRNITPLGAMALLSALQNNIALAEKVILRRIWQEGVGCCIDDFNAITVVAFPANPYVLYGEPVRAKIFMADYNKSMKMTIRTSEGRQVADERGIAHWQGRAAGLGKRIVHGTATIIVNDSVVSRPFSFEYFVGNKAWVTLAADKGNFCYRGRSNYITVTADGWPGEKISLDVPGAETRLVFPGYFEVIPPGAGASTITACAWAKDSAGTLVPLGIWRIKLKEPPQPIASFGNKTPGIITAGELQRLQRLYIAARDPDEAVQYEVESWQCTLIKKSSADEPVTLYGDGSAASNNEVQRMLATAKPGDRVLATDITAQDHSGHTCSVSPLCVRVE